MRIHDVNLTAKVTKSVTKRITEQEREIGIRALVSMCKKFGGSILDVTESVVHDLVFRNKRRVYFSEILAISPYSLAGIS